MDSKTPAKTKPLSSSHVNEHENVYKPVSLYCMDGDVLYPTCWPVLFPNVKGGDIAYKIDNSNEALEPGVQTVCHLAPVTLEWALAHHGVLYALHIANTLRAYRIVESYDGTLMLLSGKPLYPTLHTTKENIKGVWLVKAILKTYTNI